MTEFTKDEALAFVDAIRLQLNGKVGFTWLVAKLSGLSAYIESLADENRLLNDYLDSVHARDDYEAYRGGRDAALGRVAVRRATRQDPLA